MSNSGIYNVFATKSYLFNISYGNTTNKLFIFLLYTNHIFFNSYSSLINRSFYFDSISSFFFLSFV